MCLTQQEGEVRNILITSQIQQQSLSFLQRHRGAFGGDDSDSDSDDDSDNGDNGATFSTLPDAYKHGALFSGGIGEAARRSEPPQQQNTTTGSTSNALSSSVASPAANLKQSFLNTGDESDSDSDDDEGAGAAAFASLPDEYKNGALFSGLGLVATQQPSVAFNTSTTAPAAASSSTLRTSMTDVDDDDDDESDDDDDSDAAAAFASLPDEYKRGVLFSGLFSTTSSSETSPAEDSKPAATAVADSTKAPLSAEQDDLQARKARLMQQRRIRSTTNGSSPVAAAAAAACTTTIAEAVLNQFQPHVAAAQRVSLSEQEHDDDESSYKVATTIRTTTTGSVGLHHNTKPFAAASSNTLFPAPFVPAGTTTTTESNLHAFTFPIGKEESFRTSTNASEADTVGGDHYYCASKAVDEEEDDDDHFGTTSSHHPPPPIRRTSKEFDAESVVSEMTRLSAMTTFSSDYSCDTVDTAFFCSDDSEGHLSNTSDIEDEEDDFSQVHNGAVEEDDDEDSILNEEHLDALINCATRQLEQERCKDSSDSAALVVPPLSWNTDGHKSASDAVAEAVTLAANLFSVPPKTTTTADSVVKKTLARLTAPMQSLSQQVHTPVVFHTISGSSTTDVADASASYSCCYEATLDSHMSQTLVRNNSTGSALGELQKMVQVEDNKNDTTAEGTIKLHETQVQAVVSSPPSLTKQAECDNCHSCSNNDQVQFLQKHVNCMTTSHTSQMKLQEWDAKMGLRRCHCKTMMDTCASRRALLEVLGLHVEEYEPPAVVSRKRSRAAAAIAAAAAITDAYAHTGERANATTPRSSPIRAFGDGKRNYSSSAAPEVTTSSSSGNNGSYDIPRIVHTPRSSDETCVDKKENGVFSKNTNYNKATTTEDMDIGPSLMKKLKQGPQFTSLYNAVA